MYPLDYLALALIALFCYMFLKSGIDVITYKKPPRYLILVISSVFTVLFVLVSVPLSFVFLIASLALMRIGWKELAVITAVAGVGIVLGIFIITAGLAIIGTALHIPGYELHGGIQQLMYRAMGGR